MPDLMDAVQQHAQDMADDALRAHASRPQQQGLAFCEDEACGEAIAPARRAMGPACAWTARRRRRQGPPTSHGGGAGDA